MAFAEYQNELYSQGHAYGLALGGVDGIVHVLRSLLAEAELIMPVDGYPSHKDLTPEALRPLG